jgi:hypothetical protein
MISLFDEIEFQIFFKSDFANLVPKIIFEDYKNCEYDKFWVFL